MGSCSTKKFSEKSKLIQSTEQSQNQPFAKALPITIQSHSVRRISTRRRLTYSPNTQKLQQNQIILPTWQKSDLERITIKKQLDSHILFSHFAQDTKQKIIDTMKLEQVDQNQLISLQGQKSNKFFLINTGQVGVQVDEQDQGALQAGNSFGYLALIHGIHKSATLKSLSKVHM